MANTIEREQSWTREQLEHIVAKLQWSIRFGQLSREERGIAQDQLAFYGSLKETANR